MIVDVLSALTYAQSRADQLGEPFTVYYIPEANVYAFGKIGSLPIVQQLYKGLSVKKVITLDPSHWHIDIEE